MLGNAMVVPTVGVKDIEKAKKFYEGKLGLELSMGENGWLLYKSGEGTMLNVYETESGGTNKATNASWKVDDLEAEMKDLRSKGVEFEDYDMPDMKTENGVATWGEKEKAAWFKDPEGNILCLMEVGK